MTHSPAEIIRQLLLELGYVTLPESSEDWPCYVSSMPQGEGVPNDVVCVTDTAGVQRTRTLNGRNHVAYGIQVRSRSLDYSSAYQRVSQIAEEFESVHRKFIMVGDTVYWIDAIYQSGPAISMGQDEQRLANCSLNITMSLLDVPESGFHELYFTHFPNDAHPSSLLETRAFPLRWVSELNWPFDVIGESFQGFSNLAYTAAIDGFRDETIVTGQPPSGWMQEYQHQINLMTATCQVVRGNVTGPYGPQRIFFDPFQPTGAAAIQYIVSLAVAAGYKGLAVDNTDFRLNHPSAPNSYVFLASYYNDAYRQTAIAKGIQIARAHWRTLTGEDPIIVSNVPDPYWGWDMDSGDWFGNSTLGAKANAALLYNAGVTHLMLEQWDLKGAADLGYGCDCANEFIRLGGRVVLYGISSYTGSGWTSLITQISDWSRIWRISLADASI